ncbi:hypothetical protein SH501x_004465 [Pirellulaceae bacterium SH501]
MKIERKATSFGLVIDHTCLINPFLDRLQSQIRQKHTVEGHITRDLT